MAHQLTQVQEIQDGKGGNFLVGFNILDEQGAPLVSFGYMDPGAAAQARPLIERGIAEAVLISQACR